MRSALVCALVIGALALTAPTAGAAVHHAAHQFTLVSDSLDTTQIERLTQRILRAVSQSDTDNLSAIALYSPTCVVHWSPQDLTHAHALEEVAERCLGFDMVVRGHVTHINRRARITLQYGIMQGTHLLVLPAVEEWVDVVDAAAIPDAVASLFLRTWPVIMQPLSIEGQWGAGLDAGLREGDIVYPLGALPPDRAALTAALEGSEPVEVVRATPTSSRLAEGADPEAVYVRVALPTQERLFEWRAQVLDREGAVVDFGTLTLSSDSGWSAEVDLAATEGRCEAEIPLGTPIVAQLTVPRGTVYFESLLLDPLAEEKRVWHWSDVIRNLVADLHFTGEEGQPIGVRVGDVEIAAGETAPPLTRSEEVIELTSAPSGIIVPFTYSVALRDVHDGATIALPLFPDHLSAIQDLLEQGDITGALARFEESLEPSFAESHPQYSVALSAIHAAVRQRQTADPETLARLWALHFDTARHEVRYPGGAWALPTDHLMLLANAAELSRALAHVDRSRVALEDLASLRADLIALGGSALRDESLPLTLRRQLVAAHLDLFDAAVVLAEGSPGDAQWRFIDTLVQDIEGIQLTSDTLLLTDSRFRDVREAHVAMRARVVEQQAEATRSDLDSLRQQWRVDDLDLERVEDLLADADLALRENPEVNLNTAVLNREIEAAVRDAIDRGRDRIVSTRPQREALRSAGYLYDLTQTLDRTEADLRLAEESGDLVEIWLLMRPALERLDETGLERWMPVEIEAVAEVDQALTDTLEEVREGDFPGRAEALVAAQGWRHRAQEHIAAGEMDAARRLLAQADDHLTSVLNRPQPMTIAVARLTDPAIDDEATGAESISDLLHWGTELFRRGNYVGARRVFQQAREQESDSYLAWFGEGHAAFAVGDYRTASRSIREGLNRFPTWTSVTMNRRDFYDVVSDYDAHLNLAEIHLRQYGPDPAVLFCLGYNLYYDGDLASAAHLLAQIPPQAPEHNAAQHYLSAMSGMWQ